MAPESVNGAARDDAGALTASAPAGAERAEERVTTVADGGCKTAEPASERQSFIVQQRTERLFPLNASSSVR
jgi:hypothetical protein